MMRPVRSDSGNGRGIHVKFGGRALRRALLVAAAISMLGGPGCAPTYNRIRIPAGGVVTPDAWRPGYLGARIRLFTVAGVRYEGTVIALGDSISMRVLDGPGPAVQTFPRSEVARAEVRPRKAAGERAMQILFFTPIIAMALLWYGMRGYD